MRVAQSFSSPRNETIYGLGQQQNGLLNQKGVGVELDQFNTQVSIPWYVSSGGYGILWNSPGRGRLESSLGDLPAATPLPYASSRTTFVAEAATGIDYYLTTHPVSAAAAPKVSRYGSLMRRLAEATGKPPPFNPGLTLFWQCKLRYSTQEEVLKVQRQYVSKGLNESLLRTTHVAVRLPQFALILDLC